METPKSPHVLRLTSLDEAQDGSWMSNNAYETLFSLPGVCITEVHPFTGRFLRISPFFCQWLGYAESELLQKTFFEISHPDDSEMYRHLYDQMLRGKTHFYRVEKRYVCKDGDIVWGHVTSSLARDEAGRPWRTLGIIQDITEQKTNERSIREKEERIRLACDAGQVGSWHWELRRDSLDCDSRCAQIFGLDSASSLKYPDLLSYIHPGDKDRFRAAISESLLSLGEHDAQFRVIRPDGTLRWVQSKGCAYSAGDDGAGRISGVMVDVTERKQAEQSVRNRLRELEVVHSLSLEVTRAGLLEEIYQKCLDGVMEATEARRSSLLLFDEDGVMRFKAWRDLSDGYRELVEGHSPWTSDDPSPQPITVSDVHQSDEWQPYCSLFDSEGIRAMAFIPLVWKNRLMGKFMVYFGEFHEFTTGEIRLISTIANHVAFAIDRLKGEQALAQKTRLLEEADRRKDEFLAVLGHELRNPLSAIKNGLYLLEAESISPEQVVWTRQMMGKQVGQLVELLNELLDMTRISRGKISLRKRPVQLAAAVDRALEGSRALLAKKEHRVDVVPIASELYLEADPTRLEQILVNLITNAAKYTPRSGTIRISSDEEDGQVRLVIRDNGVGLSKKDLEKIFEPFAQVRSSGSARGGLGIGLTLVRQLVELHGGRVFAVSDGHRKGSSFTLCFPKGDVTTPQPNIGEHVVHEKNILRGLKVMMVDDNVDAIQSLAIMLAMAGCEVETAEDGRGALAKVGAYRPDVLLLDIGLPDIPGYVLADRIRQEMRTDTPHMVAITGFGHAQARRWIREAGFDRYFLKPVKLENLLDHLVQVAATRPSR